MKIDEIIENTGQVDGLPPNPRFIKREKLQSLANSILLFPEMMSMRPIIVDEGNVCLGGTMRTKALREIKSLGEDAVKEYLSEKGKDENFEIIKPIFKGLVPDGWVVQETNLTLDQKKEFILKDNNPSGAYDFDVLLNDWGKDILALCDIDIPDNLLSDIKDDDDFMKRFNSIDDTNCIYPIVPKIGEKHELFLIVSDSEVDSNHLREKLGMQKMKSYKSDQTSKSNVIHIKDVINALQDSNTVV